MPYAALPLATLVASDNNTPMGMRRKQVKADGTKKTVEGMIVAGQRCIIIDDVCTSGESVLETVQDLRSLDLVVTDAVVLLDRQATGTVALAEHGIKLHAALNLSQVCEVLVKHGQLLTDVARQVAVFMSKCRQTESISVCVGIFPLRYQIEFFT